MAVEELPESTREGILQIAPRHGVCNVRVFGSVGRGDARLDGFEGVPSSYKRCHVSVTDQHERNHTVWTYFANPQDDPPKEYDPHEDCMSLYVNGAEHLRLPEHYLEFLRGLKAKAQH